MKRYLRALFFVGIVMSMIASCQTFAAEDAEYETKELGNISFEYPAGMTQDVEEDDDIIAWYGESEDCNFSVNVFKLDIDFEEYDMVLSTQNGIMESFDSAYTQYDEDLCDGDKIAWRKTAITDEYGDEITDAVYYVFDGVNYIAVRMQSFSTYQSETTAKNLNVMNHIIDTLSADDNISNAVIYFRDCEWDSTVEDVMEKEITSDMIEGIDYYYEDDVLTIIDGSVAGYDCYTYFAFNEQGKFVRGMYSLKEEHSNQSDYYQDYVDLVELYVEKYGDDYEEAAIWKDETFKNDIQNWGHAVSVGDVKFGTMWTDENGTTIVMALAGDNYEISTSIAYTSAKYESKKNTDGI